MATLPQTAWQRARMSDVQRHAQVASERAQPALIDALDEPRFRLLLTRCCSSFIANTSTAAQLLQMLRDEYAHAEIATGFFAAPSSSSGAWGFTLEDGVTGDRLLNQWEVRIKHNGSFYGGKGWFSIQDDVETRL